MKKLLEHKINYNQTINNIREKINKIFHKNKKYISYVK